MKGRKRVSRWSKGRATRKTETEEGGVGLAKTQRYIRQREQHAPTVGRALFSRQQKQAVAAARGEGQRGGSELRGRLRVPRTLGFVYFLNDNRKPLRVLN